ncbi:protein MOS2-like [Coffea eugenioides]|uniref:protein MOS2-like n=1 Tax=Coffea eugenioides TaxID=49369 RepID=UPI000F615DB1|nr:protein MOS2-like [Coffea eugenioides]
MKLSFSLSSKPPNSTLKKPSAAATDSEESKEFVTEFDSSKAPTAKNRDNRVIPPKPNEWRPTKRMKNLELPLQSDAQDQPMLQFEVVESGSSDPTSESMSYGLNLRNSGNGAGANPQEFPGSASNGDPVLHKLREDLKRLPEDAGFEEFEDMPVEGFGRALLGGYGWVEGKGIGKNAKKDVDIVVLKKRTGKEGLGFTGGLPELPAEANRENGGGTNNGRRKGSDRDGKEKGREKKDFYVGKEVRIVGGREVGMKGRILEVKHSAEVAILRLLKSEEDVSVYVSDLADLGSVEEERCLRKLKELRIREKSDVSDKKIGRGRDKDLVSSWTDSRDREMKDRKKDGKRGRGEIKGSDKSSWLTNHIRVRIISKNLKGGRLYLKKGEVVDVVGPTTCDISMDENRELIQEVDQELLETALPRRGGPVLVLYGKHKGVYGSLVERDTEKETGVVRDADSHELLNVRLEQIAEYIGDPSYVGY